MRFEWDLNENNNQKSFRFILYLQNIKEMTPQTYQKQKNVTTKNILKNSKAGTKEQKIVDFYQKFLIFKFLL